MSLTTSVIICAYTQNRWSQLLSAAESVRKQTTPAAEVLIVIDHNDELRNRAEQAMPWARVVVELIAAAGASTVAIARLRQLGAVRPNPALSSARSISTRTSR